jgi:hypothetical protein
MPPTRRTGKPPPHTEWHGNHYRAKLRIPEQLRIHFTIDESGSRFKKFLYENLRTDDPAEAAEAAEAFVVRMQRRFKRLARRDRIPSGLLSEARRWSSNLTPENNPAIQRGQPAPGPPIDAEDLEALGLERPYTEGDALVDRAYDLEERIGTARAMRFFNQATGRTTPIATAMEDWLRSRPYTAATRRKYQKTVEDLIDWCRSNRIPAAIEEINFQRATRFISRHGSRNSKAIDNERAALSSLWERSNERLMAESISRAGNLEDWAGDRGDNPWREVGAQASSGDKKRLEK